jgi:hypothetical protein
VPESPYRRFQLAPPRRPDQTEDVYPAFHLVDQWGYIVNSFVGTAGNGSFTAEYYAASDLEAFRVVCVSDAGYWEYASADNPDHQYRALGLTLMPAIFGEIASASLVAIAEYPDWNWNPNQPIYLGLNGNLTQDVTSLLFERPIAVAVDRHKIFFGFGGFGAGHSGSGGGNTPVRKKFFQATPVTYQEFIHNMGDDPATILIYDLDGEVIGHDSVSIKITDSGKAIAIQTQTAIAYHLILGL